MLGQIVWQNSNIQMLYKQYNGTSIKGWAFAKGTLMDKRMIVSSYVTFVVNSSPTAEFMLQRRSIHKLHFSLQW